MDGAHVPTRPPFHCIEPLCTAPLCTSLKGLAVSGKEEADGVGDDKHPLFIVVDFNIITSVKQMMSARRLVLVVHSSMVLV